MSRATFEVVAGSVGSYVNVTLPQGVVVRSLKESFIAASASVRSRAAPKPFAKVCPLQEFWALEPDAELTLSSIGPCAIKVVDVGDGLMLRPGVLFACESTVDVAFASWASSDWIKASGAGRVVLYSAGTIVELASAASRGQVAAARVLAYTASAASGSPAVGNESSLWNPDPGAVVWATTARHDASDARPIRPRAQGASFASFWTTATQTFGFLLFCLVFILFSDSFADFDYGAYVDQALRWFQGE